MSSTINKLSKEFSPSTIVFPKFLPSDWLYRTRKILPFKLKNISLFQLLSHALALRIDKKLGMYLKYFVEDQGLS